jgi:aminoglycoside phosphotransferase (APT) family kinase protein
MSTELMLPADVLAWIQEAAGAPVVRADRIPGGGTRQGWFVDIGQPGSPVQNLFLRYSPEALSERSAFHPLATEAQVIRALSRAGIPVPAVHAVHPDREAVLLDRVSGETWFYRIRDPQEQVRVAQDFIRNLAAVHRLDPRTLEVPGLGPVRSARDHALERIADIRRRGTAPDGSMDPLVRLSADWLERNVPDYDGPVVLVQGDTGPGNFLYQDGRVTAVLDWELCHFGDPMDDIAWLSLRTVQDTFTHLPDRLAEYAQASGHPIDVDRIWYYRVFAETTMATLSPDVEDSADEDAAAQKDVGNLMLYRQLHRRLWLEALDVVMGLGLTRPEVPDSAALPHWHGLYGDALAMLRTITPRIHDPLAAQWTKGVARLVTYLRELDASGRQYADLELDDLAAVLGYRPGSVGEGRAEAAEATATGKVSGEDYVRYLWNAVMREDHLMRHASGALSRRSWPPLVDADPGNEATA